MQPVLVVERADGESPVRHQFRLPIVRIGRALDNDLVLDDPQVSRQHLELCWRDGALVVHSPGLKPASINGRPLAGAEPLRSGTEIRVGRRSLVVTFVVPESELHRAETMTPCEECPTESELIGSSPAMVRIRDLIRRLAPSDATILVRGERGTGKEMVARLLHRMSRRAAGPYRIVNCPAIPAGLVESQLFGILPGKATGVAASPGTLALADGGTVFFDEIAELEPLAQAKLLRFLQEKTIDPVGASEPVAVDVRIVAATNRDLEAEVASGRFRADLLERLAVAELRLPPLRDHREDIDELVRHFLASAEPRPAGISSEALAELRRREHPGNVRALRNAIIAGAALAGGARIELGDLPLRQAATSGDPVESLRSALLSPAADFERDFVERYKHREIAREHARALFRRLIAEFGTITQTAEALRVAPKRLMNVLREQRLRAEDS